MIKRKLLERRVVRVRLWCALIGFSSLTAAHACVHSYPIDANSFFAAADVVALVEMRTWTQERPPGLPAMNVATLICYKGCAPRTVLRVSVESCEVGPPGYLGKPMLVFAKREGAILKAVDQDALWTGPAISLLESASLGIGPEIDLRGLQQALAVLIPDTNAIQGSGSDALKWLGSFSQVPAALRSSIREVAVDERAPLSKRLLALTALLREPTEDEVGIAAAIAEENGPHMVDGIDHSIIGALLGGVKTPAAFDGLARIAVVPGLPRAWRQAALAVLRRFGNVAALPVFMKALDSPDWYSQYLATEALGELTSRNDAEHKPEMLDEFRLHSERYIGTWKNWWVNDGRLYYEERIRQSMAPR